MTLWGSRLIVMVANILGGGGGRHGWALKQWLLEIQAMVQIHCNLSLNAGVVGGGRLVIRKFIKRDGAYLMQYLPRTQIYSSLSFCRMRLVSQLGFSHLTAVLHLTSSVA